MLKFFTKSNYTLWLIVLGAAMVIFIATMAIVDRVASPADTQQAASSTTEVKKPATDLKTGYKIGELAPDFNLMTVDNKMMNLSDYKGKNIILNFWATWCGPCTFEIPFLKQIDEKWAKAGVTVIAVNTQDNIENAVSFAKSNNLNFVIPVDPRGGAAAIYNVRGLPTSFFIDSDGVVKSIKIGPFINADEIEERMTVFK